MGILDTRPSCPKLRLAIAPAILLAAVLALAPPLLAASRAHFEGVVSEAGGAPVAGAMVTFTRGDPAHSVTVWSGDDGVYRSAEMAAPGDYDVRVRRIGWKDLRIPARRLEGATRLDLTLERETDPAEVAAQLPANHWYQLVLEQIEDASQREEFQRQCTYCHQQGNAATRVVRSEDEWRKLIALMGRRGGMLSRDLREKLPALFIRAYDPDTAVPRLTAGMDDPGFAPPPPAAVRRAVVDEWELGGRASMQHDLTVHPDGRIYSVDMNQDRLFRLDPSVPGGGRESWLLPHGDLPLGGVFGRDTDTPAATTSNSYVGPHSLQVGPDGSIWITLALGNQLARFDPADESITIVELEHGYYPHTLRFDARGRIWYTIAASNHLGMYDTTTGEHREMRLPAGNFTQAVALRLMPFLLWLDKRVDLRSAAAEGDGMQMPIPYGVDVSPEGVVWFSQLNEHRIGRVDPDTFEVEMIDTPFPAPRRLRFDSRGNLWIPSFSGGLIARFDPETREFRTWDVPIEPKGSDTPYALHVDRRNDDVWICGTNSDTLIRFEPGPERFTVYPLPTRVTYTRELDFDRQGRVWTSNSNAPTWQIEGGTARVLRLDPNPDVAEMAGGPPGP